MAVCRHISSLSFSHFIKEQEWSKNWHLIHVLPRQITQLERTNIMIAVGLFLDYWIYLSDCSLQLHQGILKSMKH